MTYLNLFLLHRFAQLCFLRNEISLALTSNASKHVAKTVICNDIRSYFEDMQISKFALVFLIFAIRA